LGLVCDHLCLSVVFCGLVVPPEGRGQVAEVVCCGAEGEQAAAGSGEFSGCGEQLGVEAFHRWPVSGLDRDHGV
jgi:hypothetical protein